MAVSRPAIKLYGIAASRAVRVIWMLHELGLAFEHDPVSNTDPKLKQASYTSLNPNGRIPTLVVDGFAIFESLAINLYLVEKFGGPLAAKTIEERASMAQWSIWAMTEIDKDVTVWAFNTLVKPPAERDAKAAADAHAALQRPLAALEKVLSEHNNIVGDRFTAADVNVAGVMYRALAMDLSAYPKVLNWLTRCWSREAALKARRARGDKV